jgi:hypothetical protein
VRGGVRIILIAGIILAGCYVPTTNDEALTVPRVPLPNEEAQICFIINDAAVKYERLSGRKDTASEGKNDIATERLERQITNLITLRNERVFAVLRQQDFAISRWVTTIKSIHDMPLVPPCHPNVFNCEPIELQPDCSPGTRIEAWLPGTPENLKFLAPKRQGDELIVTGHVAELGDGDLRLPSPVLPTSADLIDDSGSPSQPEYSADLTGVASAMVSSRSPQEDR